jgi:putative phosphoribosyl transferase
LNNRIWFKEIQMFKDRIEAGKLLAKELIKYKDDKDVLILAIPRGGVVVAYEVAKLNRLPMDVVVIKKIGTPGNEELAAGAAGVGSYILNDEIVETYRISQDYLEEQINIKQMQIRQRYEFLRGNRPFYSVEGKTIVVIDDGLATGATMTMAIRLIKQGTPKRVVCGIPVAPQHTVKRLQTLIDQVVCLLQPLSFRAIGEFYQDFSQVEDNEARRLLEEAEKFRTS